VSSRTARATQKNPVSEKKKKRERREEKRREEKRREEKRREEKRKEKRREEKREEKRREKRREEKRKKDLVWFLRKCFLCFCSTFLLPPLHRLPLPFSPSSLSPPSFPTSLLSAQSSALLYFTI
jgi:outer membrane biosynthesis protein TonB